MEHHSPIPGTKRQRAMYAVSGVLFIGLVGACVFGLLAAILAVLLDRRS